jgi:hypothetical protein
MNSLKSCASAPEIKENLSLSVAQHPACAVYVASAFRLTHSRAFCCTAGILPAFCRGPALAGPRSGSPMQSIGMQIAFSREMLHCVPRQDRGRQHDNLSTGCHFFAIRLDLRRLFSVA